MPGRSGASPLAQERGLPGSAAPLRDAGDVSLSQVHQDTILSTNPSRGGGQGLELGSAPAGPSGPEHWHVPETLGLSIVPRETCRDTPSMLRAGSTPLPKSRAGPAGSGLLCPFWKAAGRSQLRAGPRDWGAEGAPASGTGLQWLSWWESTRLPQGSLTLEKI